MLAAWSLTGSQPKYIRLGKREPSIYSVHVHPWHSKARMMVDLSELQDRRYSCTQAQGHNKFTCISPFTAWALLNSKASAQIYTICTTLHIPLLRRDQHHTQSYWSMPISAGPSNWRCTPCSVGAPCPRPTEATLFATFPCGSSKRDWLVFALRRQVKMTVASTKI